MLVTLAPSSPSPFLASAAASFLVLEVSAVIALDVKLQPAEAKRGPQILHLFDRVKFCIQCGGAVGYAVNKSERNRLGTILHFTANNVMPNLPYWTPKFGSCHKNSDVYQQ